MTPTETISAGSRRVATLSIGGVRVQLVAAGRDFAFDLPSNVLPFVCDDGMRPEIRVDVRRALIEASPLPLEFDSGGVWKLRRSADEVMFEFRSPRFGAVPYKIARFRPDFSAGEVVLHQPYFSSAPQVYPLEYPLDELIFTNLLARQNGVELHGCGVVDGDEGLLFLGFSGAGKSTMARLWRRYSAATILSDDRIVLRIGDGRMLMHGTPWHGDEAFVAKGPVSLSRVFFLHQGLECAVRARAGVEAVASMFARCFAPFHCGDAVARTVATLEQTVQLVPCADLWFTPDAAAIKFIRGRR